MTEAWIGKSVSIHCHNELGIFQGTIKNVNPTRITITKAFRNGIPLKKEFMEITIASKDIMKLDLIPTFYGNNSIPKIINGQLEEPLSANKSSRSPPNVVKQYKNTNKSPANGKSYNTQVPKYGYENGNGNGSKPIDINGSKMSSSSFRNDKKKPKKFGNKYSSSGTFGTPADDPIMDEDFDFEKNLLLFDKQAIWDEIDAIQKPDLVRQTVQSDRQKYRHDENILVSGPTQYRQIKIDNENSEEYVTDEGLVVPSIPRHVRDKIQDGAEAHGLILERQNDILARGATEVALQLLGGTRRLTPNNQHQWPKIVIICDEPYNHRISEIGISTGRQLASHGLKIVIYVSPTRQSERVSNELQLYAATGNHFTYNIEALPSCDLVIAAVGSMWLSNNLRDWINENRAPVLAIDPPVTGIDGILLKCSILPILPLDNIYVQKCGKLYLCNLGVPDKFFQDAGIKYKSPFDKFVIPIHRQD